MKKLPVSFDVRMEAGFKAGEFRKEFDALLEKHGAKFQIGWEGKWAYAQVVFPTISNAVAVTMIKVAKGTGACRYLSEDTEERYEFVKSPIPVGILLAASHQLCPVCEGALPQAPREHGRGSGGADAASSGIDPSVCG